MSSNRLMRPSSRQSFASTRSGTSDRSGDKQQDRQNGRRGVELTQVIESVFELMVGEYGSANSLEIPVSFYEFYNSALMKTFLASAIFYFYAYLRVLRVFQEDSGEVEEVVKRKQAFRKARSEQSSRLEQLGRSYARVLLTCSNFEHKVDDLLFFECVYHFTYLVLRQSVDPMPFEPKAFFKSVQSELDLLFRGPNFCKQKQTLQVDAQEQTPLLNSKKHQMAQQLLHRYQGETERPSSSHSTRSSASNSSNVSSSAGSQYHLHNHHHQKHHQRALPTAHFGIASLPVDFLPTKNRKKKFNVYKALHARSPMVDLCLKKEKK